MDNFEYSPNHLTVPATLHRAIVPSDTEDLPVLPRTIYCEGAGVAYLRDAAGTVLPYTLAQGDRLPFRPTRVMATGTTATLYEWE